MSKSYVCSGHPCRVAAMPPITRNSTPAAVKAWTMRAGSTIADPVRGPPGPAWESSRALRHREGMRKVYPDVVEEFCEGSGETSRQAPVRRMNPLLKFVRVDDLFPQREKVSVKQPTWSSAADGRVVASSLFRRADP